MKVKKVLCKSIMSKSRLGTDFSINPYRGCSHACVYCYAPYVLREKRKWGDFVDVKINCADVLDKDIRRNKKGTIFISSVTDPYHHLEKEYKLTRKILEKLIGTRFSLSIQTKSDLVLRDIDLLKQLDCEVGMTITSFNGKATKAFEPNTSSSEDRLKALNILKDNGIDTYVFFGPFLPMISDQNLEDIIKKFSDAKLKFIFLDRLNIKRKSLWEKMRKVLEEHFPEMIDEWERILFTDNDYYDNVKRDVVKLCRKYNLKYELCY